MKDVVIKRPVIKHSPLVDAYESARENKGRNLQGNVSEVPVTYELGKEYHPTGKLSIKKKQLGDKWYIYVAVETKEGVEIDLRSLGNTIISQSDLSEGEYESIRIVDNQEIKKSIPLLWFRILNFIYLSRSREGSIILSIGLMGIYIIPSFVIWGMLLL